MDQPDHVTKILKSSCKITFLFYKLSSRNLENTTDNDQLL